MVAAVSRWHQHHAAAAREIRQRLGRGEAMVVAAPTLVETYSVLTRLPTPLRVSAAEALTLVEANFLEGRELVALEGEAYVRLLRQAAADGVAGGAIYDAVVAACALAARVDALLTFNERHFLAFAGRGMEIVVPG